jgi:hypothetical protein
MHMCVRESDTSRLKTWFCLHSSLPTQHPPRHRARKDRVEDKLIPELELNRQLLALLPVALQVLLQQRCDLEQAGKRRCARRDRDRQRGLGRLAHEAASEPGEV